MYIIPLTSIEHNPILRFNFSPWNSTVFFLSKLFFSRNPFLLSLALSLFLSTSLKFCENECVDLISVKIRLYIGST